MFIAEEIAQRLNGTLHGDPQTAVTGVGALSDLTSGDIVYASDARTFARVSLSACSLILSNQLYSQTEKTVIEVADPRAAYIACLEMFQIEEQYTGAISPGAILGAGVDLAPEVTLFAGSIVQDGASLGERTVVYPGAVIGKNVQIGKSCIIHANVVIGERCVLGDNVIVHAGVVVGADGFGFYETEEHIHKKIPQLGNVVIEDDVEIGANSTIDRATAGSTVIGKGTKIDNLVHIAHNCRIGRNNLIAAQVGIAGSVVTGDSSVFAGQAGVTDHCVIGDNVFVGGKSGVISPRLRSNTAYWGNPAREMGKMKKMLAALLRLAAKE